jgi:putative lipase involved disintegration of autophagic bodies
MGRIAATRIVVPNLQENCERTEVKQVDIYVEFSEGSLSQCWDGYNMEASCERYKNMLVDHIYDEYPDANITIKRGSQEIVTVDGESDHPVAGLINDMMDRVWQQSDWEVEV